jgi:hypothetical protein
LSSPKSQTTIVRTPKPPLFLKYLLAFCRKRHSNELLSSNSDYGQPEDIRHRGARRHHHRRLHPGPASLHSTAVFAVAAINPGLHLDRSILHLPEVSEARRQVVLHRRHDHLHAHLQADSQVLRYRRFDAGLTHLQAESQIVRHRRLDAGLADVAQSSNEAVIHDGQLHLLYVHLDENRGTTFIYRHFHVSLSFIAVRSG